MTKEAAAEEANTHQNRPPADCHKRATNGPTTKAKATKPWHLQQATANKQRAAEIIYSDYVEINYIR